MQTDYVGPDGFILDIKTVACALLGAAASGTNAQGWALRDVWYREGVAAGRPLLLPDSGVLRYWFVCIEKTPPYLIEVHEMSDRARAWGEQVASRACGGSRLSRR